MINENEKYWEIAEKIACKYDDMLMSDDREDLVCDIANALIDNK